MRTLCGYTTLNTGRKKTTVSRTHTVCKFNFKYLTLNKRKFTLNVPTIPGVSFIFLTLIQWYDKRLLVQDQDQDRRSGSKSRNKPSRPRPRSRSSGPKLRH